MDEAQKRADAVGIVIDFDCLCRPLWSMVVVVGAGSSNVAVGARRCKRKIREFVIGGSKMFHFCLVFLRWGYTSCTRFVTRRSAVGAAIGVVVTVAGVVVVVVLRVMNFLASSKLEKRHKQTFNYSIRTRLCPDLPAARELQLWSRSEGEVCPSQARSLSHNIAPALVAPPHSSYKIFGYFL